jgi:lipopolysaccharide export system permease protein
MNLSLFRITLLDRYLFKDLYKTFIGVALVLVLILFANNLVLALEKILKGVVSREMLWQLMQFELLEMLSLILPPAFFFSILL